MACACRYCFPDCVDWETSYGAVIAFADVSAVRGAVHAIEAAGQIIPGITCWCPVCSRVSVLSYSNYCLLAEQDEGERGDADVGYDTLSSYFVGDCVGYYADLVVRHRTYTRRSRLFKAAAAAPVPQLPGAVADS